MATELTLVTVNLLLTVPIESQVLMEPTLRSEYKQAVRNLIAKAFNENKIELSPLIGVEIEGEK